MADYSKYPQYSLMELGLTLTQLTNGLSEYDPQLFYIFVSDDIFYWCGKADVNNPEEWDPITYPLPDTSIILENFNNCVERYNQTMMNNPRNITNIIKPENVSETLYIRTCNQIPNPCSAVSILPHSNSISAYLPEESIENKTLVSNQEYMEKIKDLPIYNYNLKNSEHPRIFPMYQDWINVFPNTKDKRMENIEINDVIGVMLTCIKNLNERITELENKIN